MENKKNILDYLTHTFVIFGVTVAVLSVITAIWGEDAQSVSTMFALGRDGIPLYTLLQYLLICACITLLRFLLFTDILLKKGSVAFRTILMVTSVILLTGLFAYLFGWFPVSDPRCWLSFFLCFCCCFAISTVISIRKESLDNQKLADGLKHLKEDQKHDND